MKTREQRIKELEARYPWAAQPMTEKQQAYAKAAFQGGSFDIGEFLALGEKSLVQKLMEVLTMKFSLLPAFANYSTANSETKAKATLFPLGVVTPDIAGFSLDGVSLDGVEDVYVTLQQRGGSWRLKILPNSEGFFSIENPLPAGTFTVSALRKSYKGTEKLASGEIHVVGERSEIADGEGGADFLTRLAKEGRFAEAAAAALFIRSSELREGIRKEIHSLSTERFGGAL